MCFSKKCTNRNRNRFKFRGISTKEKSFSVYMNRATSVEWKSFLIRLLICQTNKFVRWNAGESGFRFDHVARWKKVLWWFPSRFDFQKSSILRDFPINVSIRRFRFEQQSKTSSHDVFDVSLVNSSQKKGKQATKGEAQIVRENVETINFYKKILTIGNVSWSWKTKNLTK